MQAVQVVFEQNPSGFLQLLRTDQTGVLVLLLLSWPFSDPWPVA